MGERIKGIAAGTVRGKPDQPRRVFDKAALFAYVIIDLNQPAAHEDYHHKDRQNQRDELRCKESQSLTIGCETDASRERDCQKYERHQDEAEHVFCLGLFHYDSRAYFLNQLNGLKSDAVDSSPSLSRCCKTAALRISRSARSISKMLLGE